jgi:hypothetical protein
METIQLICKLPDFLEDFQIVFNPSKSFPDFPTYIPHSFTFPDYMETIKLTWKLPDFFLAAFQITKRIICFISGHYTMIYIEILSFYLSGLYGHFTINP